MRFEHRVTIPAPRDKVWQFLMQVPEVGRCVPGVTEVKPLSGDDYEGTMKVRIGPVALQLQGKLSIIERDEAGGRATMSAQAADRRAGGAVNARMQMQLEPKGSSETDLVVTTDANVLGKLGEFGQPLIRKKANQTMDEFARNVKTAIAS
jgi:carbon monoxide dehydrogenase subunit G